MNDIIALNHKCELCKKNIATLLYDKKFLCSKCRGELKPKETRGGYKPKKVLIKAIPKSICFNCQRIKRKNRILESMLSRARKQLREIKSSGFLHVLPEDRAHIHSTERGSHQYEIKK